MHTGRKPFVCTFPGCGKAFRQAGKLSVHKKLHRNIVFEVLKHKKKKEKGKTLVLGGLIDQTKKNSNKIQTATESR